MIVTGRKGKFFLIASSRGYSAASVAECIVWESGDLVAVDTSHAAYPHARPGLGDMVAAGLESVGITKGRVSAITTAITGRPCRCGKRQKALNELGRRVGIGVESPPG